MGNDTTSGYYNGKNKHKKMDKLTFAETPQMYERNMSGNYNRNNTIKKSIVLQRRYRDDSIAEESISVASMEQKVNNEVVEGKKERYNKNKDIVVPINNVNNGNDVVLPVVNNNKPFAKERKELPEIEGTLLNTRQRRYRPYNPVIHSVPTKHKAHVTNNKPQRDDSESVEYYNNYNNDHLNYTTSRYNTKKTFNKTQLFPSINANNNTFCQCDRNNNTCTQCGLITSTPKCCCTCSCYKHKCINHCKCYPLHTSHNITTPPKRFREQSYLLHEHPRSNYFPIQEPLVQANSFFNYHYAPNPSMNVNYTKHKSYLSNDEKHHSIIPLSNTSYKAIPYTNAFRLHHGSITYIVSLTPPISQTFYATSSIDNTIKLWDDNIHLISTIQTHKTYSKCLLHFQTEFLLSAEGINIFAYTIRLPNTVQYIFRDHIEEVNFLLSIGDRFISAGNDKTLRLWNISTERVCKCYDGHRGTVRKVTKVFNGVYLASFGDDKKILVWELTQSFPLTCVDTYYTIADVHGTGFGFVSGSYDNKIRFYSLRGGIADMFAVFEMDYYYHCRSFISGNEQDSALLFTTFVNEIIALDVKMKTIVRLFKGPPYDKRINMIIKDSLWENRCGDDNDKHFIGICQDGCLYIWNYTCNESVNSDTTNNESKLNLPTLDTSNGNYKNDKELNVLNSNDNDVVNE